MQPRRFSCLINIYCNEIMYPTGLYEVPVLEAAEDCFAAKKGTDSWGEVNRI
jgi:hypothetical protein